MGFVPPKLPCLRLGEHVPPETFDQIAAGGLGSSRERPFATAPADWHDNGVPYGAWCRCARCDMLGRSTIVFDFYADKAGDPLECENCRQTTRRLP